MEAKLSTKAVAAAKSGPISKTEMSDLAKTVQALGADKAFGNMKVGELKEYCTKFGLKPTGKKQEIIAILSEYLAAGTKAKVTQNKKRAASNDAGGSASAGKKADCATEPKAEPKPTPAKKAASTSMCAEEDLIQMVQALGAEEALGNLKVTELKEYCSKFGIKATGVKVEIIALLGKHLLGAIDTAAAQPGTDAKKRKAGDTANRSELCDEPDAGLTKQQRIDPVAEDDRAVEAAKSRRRYK